MTTAPDTSPDGWYTSLQREQQVMTPKCIARCGGEMVWNETTCSNGCDLAEAYRTWAATQQAFAILQHESHEKRLSAAPLPRVWTLAELMADDTLRQPPRFIIPPLVEASAVTLVSAPPKCGKTTLASQLAADLSSGRASIDGTPLPPGVVLWIAVDEPVRRLVPRLLSFGADMHRFRIVVRDADVLTPERIAALLNEVDPQLLVIDTLSQLASDNAIKPNDAESVVPFMKALVAAVQRRPNCGALLIFHSPHHAARAAGSLQWAATVDATYVLRRRAPKVLRVGEPPDDDATNDAEDGRRILEGVSRWDGPQRLNLSFSGGRYTLGTGEAPLIDRVRWMLTATEVGPRQTSRNAIAKAVQARDVAVAEVIRQLIDRGEATYSGTGPAQHVVPTASLRLYLTGGSGEAGESGPEAVTPAAPANASHAHTPMRELGRQYEDGPPLDLIAADGPPSDGEDAA